MELDGATALRYFALNYSTCAAWLCISRSAFRSPLAARARPVRRSLRAACVTESGPRDRMPSGCKDLNFNASALRYHRGGGPFLSRCVASWESRTMVVFVIPNATSDL
ncbi:hypothetical protein EVAR_102871_1 [Eumeta japonica]|uniref:Uncharacterized protein n=1 Tax=Eumeta variegata TaxID=151549 RepID=A0A4C1UNH4_EUMVA|nr:hypothetical protein EVAR_102871_1 [Eumeta japonica]